MFVQNCRPVRVSHLQETALLQTPVCSVCTVHSQPDPPAPALEFEPMQSARLESVQSNGTLDFFDRGKKPEVTATQESQQHSWEVQHRPTLLTLLCISECQ